MKAYVITILDNPRSVEVADRCIASGREFGVDVEKWPATVPGRESRLFMEVLREDLGVFDDNPYSRPGPTIATLLSHRALWEFSQVSRRPVLILEHDAVFVAPLPEIPPDVMACNFARPSFGTFRTPADGFGPLFSKSGGYLGGAHGYYVSPEGADAILAKIHEAEPTDVFLNVHRFPFFQEYHPWPIVCDDSFTTIQNEEGCKAKHNRVEII